MADARGDRSTGRGRRGLAVRGVLLIIVLGVLGTAAGFGVGSKYASEFTAKATILISPLIGNPFNPDGRGDDLVNLTTEAQLVDSDAVAQKVVDKLGGTDANGMLSGLSVEVPPNTQILALQYVAGSRTNAQERAQAFAEAYLDFRTARSQQVISARASRIQSEIDAQTARLDVLVRRLNGEKARVRRAVIQQQVDGATTQIGQLRTAIAQLQTGEVDPGQVVTPSHVVSRSPAASRVLFTLGGLVVGLLVAILLLALLSRRTVLARDDERVVERSHEFA